MDNQANPISVLNDGIEVGLEGQIEKFSEPLDRNALYSRKGRLITTPKYLIVQKIRFIWKEKNESTGDGATKAKILRSVNFPKVLDLTHFVSDDLKAEFKRVNEKIKTAQELKAKADNDRFEEFKKAPGNEDLDTQKLNKKFKDEQKIEDIKEHDRLLWKEFGSGEQNGQYELVGVITHQGRSADSGHYVGWTHHSGDDWHKYDDDYVTKVKIEEILALRGGGDWHMAYYLIYRRLEHEVPTD